MASHSPALGEALLVLPEPWAETRAGAASDVPRDIDQRLSRAQSHARAQARAGEEIFRVALALQDSVVDDLLPSAMSSFTRALHSPGEGDSSPGTADWPRPGDAADAPPSVADMEGIGAAATGDNDVDCMITLRARAVVLVASGDIAGAITILCALMDWPGARNDAALGLAICAVRLERHEAALALALDYLRRGGKHPRAHCIVGLCHLRRGDRRAAQNHLAIAARAARGDVAFRDELRAAQRLLIMLNFGR